MLSRHFLSLSSQIFESHLRLLQRLDHRNGGAHTKRHERFSSGCLTYIFSLFILPGFWRAIRSISSSDRSRCQSFISWRVLFRRCQSLWGGYRYDTSYLGPLRYSTNQAAELDPTAHANYYKRATAYLSMGRHNAALDDFEQILKINPGFVQVSAILSFIASVALLFWCEEERTTKGSSMKVGWLHCLNRRITKEQKSWLKKGTLPKRNVNSRLIFGPKAIPKPKNWWVSDFE